MASVNVLSKAAKTQLSNYRLAVIDVFDTHYDILNSLLKTSIDTFASKAFQARLISEPVWEEKSYSSIVHEFKTGLKLCKSISEVQTQCCSFVDILVDLNGPARTFGKDLCEELQKLFGNLEIIPNGLNEVKTEIPETTSDDKQLIPRADTDLLTNLLKRIDEVRELKKIAASLHKQFHKLTDEVKDSLISNNIGLDKVKSFVDQELKLDIRIKEEAGINVYRNELRKTEDMDSFFFFLYEYDFYGYLNYVLLKHIAELAEDEKISRKFKEYEELYVKLITKAKFKDIISIFCQNSNLKSVAPIGLPNIVFHLDDFWLQEYFHRWSTLFLGYSWYESCLLHELEENCIIVTYAILPSALNDALETLKSPAVQKKFHDLGVNIELPEMEEGITDDQSKELATMLPPVINQSESLNQVYETQPVEESNCGSLCEFSIKSTDLKDNDDDDVKSMVSQASGKFGTQIVFPTNSKFKPNQPEPPADPRTPSFEQKTPKLSNLEQTQFTYDNPELPIQESITAESDVGDNKSHSSHFSRRSEQLVLPIENRKILKVNVNEAQKVVFKLNKKIAEQTRRLKRTESQRTSFSLPKSDSISSGTIPSILSDTTGLDFPDDPILNNIMDRLIKMKEKPNTLILSISDLKDIIIGKTVSCNLFVAAVGGLPHSGKSTLVQSFLQSCLSVFASDIRMNTYEEHGLSHYGISVLGGIADESLWWMPSTQRSMHTFACSAAILHDSLLQGQQIELDQNAILGEVEKIFNDDTLNRHLNRVYCDIDRTLRRTDISPELKRVVSSGVVFGNIFDVGFSKGVYSFLSLISRYAHRQLGFVVVSIDDIHNLKEKPNLSFPGYDTEKPLMERGSKITYMVQFAAATHLAVSKTPLQSPAVAFVISSNKYLSPEQKETAKATLGHALSSEAQHLGLPKTIINNILVLNSTDDSDLQQLKLWFESMLKNGILRENIKLSWIFLRSLFYFTDRMFISKDELEAYALELNIQSSEYLEFLQKFTEFASIFYIPDIPSLRNTIILQPVKFTNLLRRLFYPPKGSEGATFDGLFTKQQVIELLSKEASEIIVPTLCSLGLAAEVPSKKIQQDKKERRPRAYSTDTFVIHFPASLSDSKPPSLLFVPSARRGNLRPQRTSFDSLLIFYDYKFTPPDVQGLFTQQLLNLPNVLFVSTSEVNVIKFIISSSKGREYVFQIIFHGTCLELIMEYHDRAELHSVCEKVLQCCKRALDTICKMIKDLSYRFALFCLQPIKLQEGDHVKTKYEILPSKQLCHSCEATKCPLRKSWNENILEMYEKTLRQSDIITPDKFFDLAMELHKDLQSHEEIKQLTAALGVDKEEEIHLALSHYSRWQRILIILLAWQKKVGPDQATKRKLSSILIRLRITTQLLS